MMAIGLLELIVLGAMAATGLAVVVGVGLAIAMRKRRN